jgi:hypothetical protein
MYEAAYEKTPPGVQEVLMPIDIRAVAGKLKCRPELLHGYLWSHLDHKYRYRTSEDSYVHLFMPTVGGMRHAINFPYLAALLAGLDQEHAKFAWPRAMSFVALVLSVAAILVQVVTKSGGQEMTAAPKRPAASSPRPAP